MNFTRRHFLHTTTATFALSALDHRLLAADATETDVCIYGATASGVAAALGAAGAGAKVIVVEPSRWLGGMSGGGLNAIDWGYKRSVGKMALKLLIEKDDVAMRELYKRELAQRGIPVIYEHRLAGVTKEGARIRSITLDRAPPDKFGCPIEKPLTANAKTVAARVFIDCSYEGDLMAKSGVSYTWGRESREEYGEFSILKANPKHSGIHRIPYRAIRPKQRECENILVPVCCSASHIAMTCIRMEPVWITLGLSTGIAAAHSIQERVAVQAIDFPRYRRALLDAGQVLELNESGESGWNSRDDWNQSKRGYEWAFDAIDEDNDGRISPAEYREFQAFKQKHADWQQQLKAKLR